METISNMFNKTSITLLVIILALLVGEYALHLVSNLVNLLSFPEG